MSDIDSRVYGYEPAASQLTELRAEIERLNALILTVSNNIASSPAKVLEESVLVGKALDRLAQQDQEIERLRSALETISIVEAGSAAAASMRLIAVRALSDKKEPNNG